DSPLRSGMFFPLDDGEGGAVVVFWCIRANFWQIYGQRFSAEGERLWGPDGLPLVENWHGDAGLKDAVNDSLGNGFISWSKSLSPINEIYVQKFNLLTGERYWGEMGVRDCGDLARCDYQALAVDGSGGVIDFWTDTRHGDIEHWYLYAQHLDADGNPLWTPNGIPVCPPWSSTPPLAYDLQAVPDDTGGGIVASWDFCLRISGAGEVLWYTSFPGSYNRILIHLLRHPEDGYLWISSWQYYPGQSIDYYLNRLDPQTGQKLFGHNDLRIGGDYLLAVNGGVMVFEPNEPYVPGHIRARRIDHDGSQIWQTDLALTEMSGSIFVQPYAVSDGMDGAVVAFEDERHWWQTRVDISAQRVLSNGSLGIPPFTPPPAEHQPLGQVLYVSGGLVCFSLPQPGEVRLELFDLLGRRVVVLSEGYRPSGEYSLRLDTGELPSGIYLLRLSAASLRQIVKVVVMR
ncbi:MAG: T9SS type A sorting domain-containing protein, partial [bacterium]